MGEVGRIPGAAQPAMEPLPQPLVVMKVERLDEWLGCAVRGGQSDLLGMRPACPWGWKEPGAPAGKADGQV